MNRCRQDNKVATPKAEENKPLDIQKFQQATNKHIAIS